MQKLFKILMILSIFGTITSVYASNDEVTAINNFELNRYLGTWYEIARLPISFEKDCIAPITATYTVDPNDNSQLIVTNSCSKANMPAEVDQGVASFTDAANIGKLKVTFVPTWLRWMPLTSGDYWIIYTDYTEYALVGSPDHKYLWIISRSEKIDQAKINKLLLNAEIQGFNTNDLIFNYPFNSQFYMPKH